MENVSTYITMESVSVANVRVVHIIDQIMRKKRRKIKMMFICTKQMPIDGRVIYPGKYDLKIDGQEIIVIGAQGINHDINLISDKEELLKCGYFIDEGKAKTMLNVEILNKFNDGSAANVLKNILFNEENKIDWNEAYNLMMTFMPELNKVDGYKLENMG